MLNIFPRKYNNPVVLGLGVMLIVAFIVIILLVVRSPAKNNPPRPPEQQPQSNNSEETYVSSGKPAIVLFHGSWCGWSKKIMPAWQAVREALLAGGSQIEALDFEDSRDKAEVLRATKLPGFRGFPDVRFYPQGYPNGEAIAYAGDRTEESLLKFAYTSGQQS